MNDLDLSLVEIRSVDGRHSAFVLTTGAAAGRRGASRKLVFDRYGNKEFLRAVELPEEQGATLPATRSEIKAARDFASHQQKGQRTAAS